MMHKHINFTTLHVSKFVLINSSGSKLNKITIMRLKIKIKMTSFMVIIILYSIRVITIIIIDRRHAFIIINLLIKPWGTKNIIFVTHSFPKLVALHIIRIMDIQGIHTNNIEIMLIIHIFYAKHSM